jgi:predicted Ser/Thr protein kinase
VERLFISKRYRKAAVTIEPQRSVDGASRPLNPEGPGSLPPLLQNIDLWDPFGDLIDANRGMVEYSDFLKRPMEANKYLLTTSEKSTLSLPNFIAYLDLVMVGTSNEKQLTLFKHQPIFSSFKGRMELIRVPYLLEISKEQSIYERHLKAISGPKHVAPHTARMAATWAVLTRLKRPRSKNYPEALGKVLSGLTPLQKALLYDSSRAPGDLTNSEKRDLIAHIRDLYEEFDDAEEEYEGFHDAAYESRRGASPREILTLLGEAANRSDFRCLSPLATFTVMRELIKDVSVYDFLRLPEDGDYHCPGKFIDDVEAEYLEIVEEELLDAIQLVEEKEYQRLFNEYFRHVKAFGTGEKVLNKATGEFEPPDDDLMEEVEKVIGAKQKPDRFRRSLIQRIAAYSIDHPGKKIEYEVIFRDIFHALKQDFYKKTEKTIEIIERNILRFGTPEFKHLSPSDQDMIKRTLARLKVKCGYCDYCAREITAFLLRKKRVPEREKSEDEGD